jgi:hypothetical protein
LSRRLEIPENALVVRLALDLPRNPHPEYRAVLVSEDREFLSRSRLTADETPERITVTLILPGDDLPTGDYTIRLYGGRETEPMEYFVFRVVRK